MATFNAGDIIFASTHEELVDAWDTYTPTWNGTLGNGTLSGRYKRIGKMVAVQFGVLWGSTTTGTGSQWNFSLPVSAAQPGSPLNDSYIGQLRMRDASASQWAGHVQIISSSTASCHTGANPIGGVTNTGPFTWANTDWLSGFALYEAA